MSEPSATPLYDDAGAARPVRIELCESSGPVAPRHQYTTKIVVEASPDMAPCVVRVHRDASGEHRDDRALDRPAYEALVAAVLASLPLGTSRDLTASKRDHKGISFNHVSVVVGDASARLDYLLSDADADESEGDPQARALVGALKRATAIFTPRD